MIRIAPLYSASYIIQYEVPMSRRIFVGWIKLRYIARVGRIKVRIISRKVKTIDKKK